jgi:hypothetical protein
MSDLRPIGEVLVCAQASNASADELRSAHQEIQAKLRRDKDPEGAALQFAWLALIAIERIRHMGESHAEQPDRRPDSGGGPTSGAALRSAPVHGPGGGWFATADAPSPSPRSH